MLKYAMNAIAACSAPRERQGAERADQHRAHLRRDAPPRLDRGRRTDGDDLAAARRDEPAAIPVLDGGHIISCSSRSRAPRSSRSAVKERHPAGRLRRPRHAHDRRALQRRNHERAAVGENG